MQASLLTCGFLVLGLLAGASGPMSPGAASAAWLDDEDPASESTSMAADDLYAAYEENEVAADERFKGKEIEVSGPIMDIGKDLLGSPYVTVGGQGLLDGVQCSFPKSQQPVLAKLKKGQPIKVRGRVEGKMGPVQLKNCKLDGAVAASAPAPAPKQEDPAGGSPSMAADDLYAAYEENEVAADERFKGKEIEVSGPIMDIGKDLLGSPYVTVGGQGLLDGVQCSFPKSQQPVLAKLKKGQPIKVRGRVEGKMGPVQLKNCSVG